MVKKGECNFQFFWKLQISYSKIFGKVSKKQFSTIKTKKEEFFANDNVILMTPEKFSENQTIIEVMKHLRDKNMIHRIVIDECHCLLTFDKFRPAYNKLSELYRTEFSTIPISFFTATSTRALRDKIQKDFNITDIDVTIGNFINLK